MEKSTIMCRTYTMTIVFLFLCPLLISCGPSLVPQVNSGDSSLKGETDKHGPEGVNEGNLPTGEEEGESMEVWFDILGSDQRIEIQKGETLVIPLASYSEEPHRWEVVDIDTSVLQEAAAGGMAPPPSQMAPRGTGAQTFRFEAVDVGETEIRFVYRPLNTEHEAPLEELTLRVTVR
jgi:predicted secreted protein